MSFFDSVYNKLFQKQTVKNPVVVHELIERDHRYKYYYDIWTESDELRNLLSGINEGYFAKKRKELSDFNVHLLESPYSNGFAISHHPSISPESFLYLFDYLADKVLNSFEYKREVSDRIISDKNSVIEEKQKHYLKPVRIGKSEPIPQLFGNIQIEHISVDNKPSYIRLMANTYSDRLFQPPEDFNNLLKTLFTKDT